MYCSTECRNAGHRGTNPPTPCSLTGGRRRHVLPEYDGKPLVELDPGAGLVAEEPRWYDRHEE